MGDPRIKTFFILIASVFIFLLPVVYAQESGQPDNPEEKSEETQEIEEIEEKEEGLQGEDESGMVGRTHKFFSQSVLDATNRVDLFFGNNRSIEEANRTRIRIRTDFDLDQGSDFEFTPNIRANIYLPGTQDKLNLFINGDEGDEGELESDIDDNENSGTLFLRYYFYKRPWGSVATDTGLRFRTSGVEWFGGIRGRIYMTFGNWGVRITDKLRWFTDRKWTNETRLDIERVIFKDRSFFRSSTAGRWFERKSGYFAEHKFQYFHKLTERRGIVLEWRTLAETRLEDFFKETRVRLRYRQNVKWKWFFVEIGPSIFWAEENDWDTNLGIRLRFEVHFGKLSDLKLF